MFFNSSALCCIECLQSVCGKVLPALECKGSKTLTVLTKANKKEIPLNLDIDNNCTNPTVSKTAKY